MSGEVPIPNRPLSLEEVSCFARLSQKEISIIDDMVLVCALPRWRKVAMIASLAKEKLETQYPEFSYVFYGERIRLLAERGRLESQGNLSYMRFSEVRLPHEN